MRSTSSWIGSSLLGSALLLTTLLFPARNAHGQYGNYSTCITQRAGNYGAQFYNSCTFTVNVSFCARMILIALTIVAVPWVEEAVVSRSKRRWTYR